MRAGLALQLLSKTRKPKASGASIGRGVPGPCPPFLPYLMPETSGDISQALTSCKLSPLVHSPYQVNKDMAETFGECVGASREEQTSGSHCGSESRDVAWEGCARMQRGLLGTRGEWRSRAPAEI